MEVSSSVLKDLVVPAVRSPFLIPKRDGYYLSEAIDLQATTSNGTDDAGIMDDLDFDAELYRSEEKVGVRSSTEGISNHQKGVVAFFILGDSFK